jgi:hypothetical protein
VSSSILGLNAALANLLDAGKRCERPNLERVGAYVVGAISDRCDRGVLPSGSKMAAYSKDYAEFRKHKGRRTDAPNLQFTGKMLGAMTWRVSGSRVTVLFADLLQNDKAVGNHNNGRPFFDISSGDIAEINRIIADDI